MEMTAQQTADLLIERISAYSQDDEDTSDEAVNTCKKESTSLRDDLREILNDNAAAVIDDKRCLAKCFSQMYFVPDPDIVEAGKMLKEKASIIEDSATDGFVIGH